MDQKQVRKLLLDAKNAIKNEDFNVAVQNCEKCLANDANDYNALVFLGAAFQGLRNRDRALISFKKAVQVSPQQTLAWQGLQRFYEKEKSKEYIKELQEVYTKLLELINDKEKCAEIWHKFGLTYLEENNFTSAENCFLKALDLEGSCSASTLSEQIWISMVSSLVSQTNLSQEQLATLQKGIDSIHEGKVNKVQQYDKWNYDSLDKYLSFLYYELQPVQLLDAVQRFEPFFKQNNVGTSKWKLRAFISAFIMGCNLLRSNEIEDILSHLAEKDDKDATALVLFVKGIILYEEGNWPASKDLVKKGLSTSPLCCWESWLLMCWTCERFCDGPSVEHFAKEGLKLASKRLPEHKQQNIQNLFYLSLGKGYFYQNNVAAFEKAIPEFLKVTVVNYKPEALYFLGLVYLHQMRLEDVTNILVTLKQCNYSLYSALNGLYLSHIKNLEEAKHFLKLALDSSYKKFYDEWLLELGAISIQENDPDLAFSYFKKAAEENVCNARPHFMLGNYFKSTLNDLKQAESCYKHAYNLKKYDEEIGICLSDVYHVNNNEEENFALLQEVTTHSPVGRCKWAWLRLGLLHLRQDAFISAIKALQSALTADPHDKECWECLGEAYLKRGSYTSAVKAFSKALELDPDMLYPAYQKANIKLTLGLHKEAAELFKNLLELVPTYVPALKGLGEAYLSLARVYLQHCEPLRTLSFCQSAFEPLTRALTDSPQLICLWKLLGDVCTMVGTLPAELVIMSVPTTLLKGIPQYNSDVTKLNKDQILMLGARCYSVACSKSAGTSYMWLDLSVNYYYQYLALQILTDKVHKLNKAMSLAKRAIVLDPTSTSNWNILGVIAASPEIRNYRLAQHCFIKATTCAPKNPLPWTNLGTFYLLNDNVELAHQSFKIAQSLEPSYPNAWIGQAACAELVADDDTIDLFRHCTTLSNHVESCIGYGSWVCNILLDVLHPKSEYDYHIKEMNAIPAAVDCITRFTNVVTGEPGAYNIMGLLLERQGLFQSAVSIFKRAYSLIKESEESSKVHQADIINCNLARVYRKLNKFKQSTDRALTVKEPDFFNLCGLAFTYYLQGSLQESSSTYEIAYNMTSSDEEKAHLLVALASVAFTVQGMDEAKTLLFQSCEVKPDCIPALFALSAVSILGGDLNVLSATMDELSSLHRDEKAMVHIAYFQSCLAILQGDVQTGRNLLCKATHRWPANFNFWKLLSKYLLQYCSSSLAVRCAESSFKLCPNPLPQILRLLCLSYYTAGCLTQANSTAKKLIHCYPGEELNWRILTELLTS